MKDFMGVFPGRLRAMLKNGRTAKALDDGFTGCMNLIAKSFYGLKSMV